MFPKALFSALYSSSYTLPLSILWSLPIPLTTTFIQMILSSSSLSTHSTLTQAFLAFKTLFNRSLPGLLLIFLLLTPLRLNSCSSDLKTNLRKYTTLHLTPPILLEILALCRTSYFLWPNYISLQSLFSLPHSSTSVVTLARPPTSCSLKKTDRFFRFALPCLWNQLPLSLRQPLSSFCYQFSISDSPIPSPITSSSSDSPLCSSISPSLFHSRRKTYLFHKSYPIVSLLPPVLPSWLLPGPFLLSYSVFVFPYFLFLCRVLAISLTGHLVIFSEHVNILCRIVLYRI